MKELLEKILSGAIGRMIRSSVATGITAWVSAHEQNYWYLAGAPLIHAIFKKLRDKYPGKIEWIPL